MNNAVIYARYSSTGQNEQSIEGQVRICKEFAESKGYNVVKTYIDKAKTGTNDKRPDFQNMINDAASSTFQYIIVYMFDRFARNRIDSIVHKNQLKEQYDVKVISALEPISDDEGGEFYEMYLEWSAEKYSKRLSKRVRDGLDTSAANGTFCGGYLIYGYKIHKEPITGKSERYIKTVVINEEQSEIVRFVFNEYINGTEKKAIANALNSKGYRYKDKPFKGRTFDKWLTNEKYTGEFTFGGRVCDNMYPAIIEKSLFDRVQKRLRDNQYSSGSNSAKEPYLLQGKAFCGHCGTLMVAGGGTSHTGASYKYYACKKMKKSKCNKKREKKNFLELYVTTRAVAYLKDSKRVDLMADDLIKYYEQKIGNDGLRSIETRISKVKQEAEELTNAFVEAKSTLLRQNIEKKISDYEILLNDLELQKSKIELERGMKITKKDIITFVSELIDGDESNKEYQRRIIDNLVSVVYVYDTMIVTILNLKGGKDVEQISLGEINGELFGGNISSNLNPTTPPSCTQLNSIKARLSTFFMRFYKISSVI